MTPSLPEPENDFDRRVLSDIDRVGWHVLNVESSEGEPEFSYSVGLFHTHRHPEIIVLGLPGEVATDVINNVGAEIERGTKLADGDRSTEILESYPVEFVGVPPSAYDEYLGYAQWLYAGSDFPVLQCVWPDRAGAFPGDPTFDPGCAARQPVLGQIR